MKRIRIVDLQNFQGGSQDNILHYTSIKQWSSESMLGKYYAFAKCPGWTYRLIQELGLDYFSFNINWT